MIDKDELYEKAYRKWGAEAQIGMLFEEIGELMVAINKNRRLVNGCDTDKVIDEIADVEIMLEQFCYMGMITREAIDKRKRQKLKRLEKLLSQS